MQYKETDIYISFITAFIVLYIACLTVFLNTSFSK